MPGTTRSSNSNNNNNKNVITQSVMLSTYGTQKGTPEAIFSPTYCTFLYVFFSKYINFVGKRK
jgi:hypothetical protein